MRYRDPSETDKRTPKLRPKHKSSWTVDKLFNKLFDECNNAISSWKEEDSKYYYGIWSFSLEGISKDYFNEN